MGERGDAARETRRKVLRMLASHLRESASLREAPMGRTEREALEALERGDAEAARRIREGALARGGARLCGMPALELSAFLGEAGPGGFPALLALDSEGFAPRMGLEAALRSAQAQGDPEHRRWTRSRRGEDGEELDGELERERVWALRRIEELAAKWIREADAADRACGGDGAWRERMRERAREMEQSPFGRWEGVEGALEGLAAAEGDRIRSALGPEPSEEPRPRARRGL